MRVLGFKDYQAQGEALAQALDADFSLIDVHRFPDGESKVRLEVPLPERIVICRSLNQPNAKLIELLLAAQTARRHGASHITLVAPYLCYMRQDKEFQPGEAVSQQIVGRLLATLFDTVVSVDPHLHRITQLHQAIPTQQALALSATGAMTEFINTRLHNPLLIGPDDESEQWVRSIAQPSGLDYRIAHKVRHSDTEVSIELPAGQYRGHEVVLVDDMVSTGRTLMGVAKELARHGAGPIHCLVTHALFDAEITRQLHAAGIEHIWSSDSIPHPTNVIPLASILADALQGIEALS